VARVRTIKTGEVVKIPLKSQVRAIPAMYEGVPPQAYSNNSYLGKLQDTGFITAVLIVEY
jgi:hypothetical protein